MGISFIVQLVGLAAAAACATVIPWMIPIAYSAIAGLLISGTDPELLMIVCVGGAVVGTTALWFTDQYFSLRFRKKFGKNLKDKKWLKRKRIKRLHEKLEKVQKPSTLFWIIAFTTRSEIPDILIIKYCRGKINFLGFFCATLLGKIFVYLPVIYGIELLSGVL